MDPTRKFMDELVELGIIKDPAARTEVEKSLRRYDHNCQTTANEIRRDISPQAQALGYTPQETASFARIYVDRSSEEALEVMEMIREGCPTLFEDYKK